MQTQTKPGIFFIKAGIFVTAISVIVASLSLSYKPSRKKIPIYTFFKEASLRHDTAYYFIGSSRVQLGIDPELLKSKLKKKDIYNAGVTAGTFLTNCIVANRLMENKTPKVLFIELTPMQLKIPNYILKHKDELKLDVFGTATSLLQSHTILEQSRLLCQLANQYLTSKIFVVDEVRNLLKISVETNERQFGFAPRNENKFHNTSSFLKQDDFNTYKYSSTVKDYQKYISILLQKAAQSNTRIMFFLPLTINNEAEKAITLPVYQALPNYLKLPLKEDILTGIRQVNYLFDNNHLNYEGAEYYSAYLANQISSLNLGNNVSARNDDTLNRKIE